MANWGEFINQTLTKFSGAAKAEALPQLVAIESDKPSSKLTLYEGPTKRRERHVKQSLSYQLFEKMRRRTLSWKSYYYYDSFEIPRIAITNDNATGTNVTNKRYFVGYEQIIDAAIYSDVNGSKILVDVNDLQHVDRELFDQIESGEVAFQVYNKLFPLEIWYDDSPQYVEKLHFLGKQKIYIDSKKGYLLRSFRNLGAEGFSALSSRLLAQEGVSVDSKNAIESLLIELGSADLLRHYQSALNVYNQESSLRRSPKDLANGTAPLIITESKQGSRVSRNVIEFSPDEVIDDESFERLAVVMNSHFSEIEEELLYISLSSLGLDRAAVIDGCSILKDKLYEYVKIAFLVEQRLENFYPFVTSLVEEQDMDDSEEREYPVLEDEAYEGMFIDLIEDIGNLTSDYRYQAYPPIMDQLDKLQTPIESLANALEDANMMQRRREISDRREILTQQAFELPNPRSYNVQVEEDQLSYYDKLIEIRENVGTIRNQMRWSIYDVVSSLLESSYILLQHFLKDMPDLESVSTHLLDLIKRADLNAATQEFELELIESITLLSSEIHSMVNNELSGRLQKIAVEMEEIVADDQCYISEEWTPRYADFVNQEVAGFNQRVQQVAFERYDEISKQIDAQFQLVDIFISGVNVPALLPSQLHESGDGLQTFLVQELQKYLNSQNLQLHTVPGREQQLRSLLNELMPQKLQGQFEQLEYFFVSTA